MKPALLVALTAAALGFGGLMLVEGQDGQVVQRGDELPVDEPNPADSPPSTEVESDDQTATTTTTVDPNVVVPDVSGLEFAAALNAMSGADLRTTRVEYPVATFDQIGTVIGQNPTPGSNAVRTDMVEIVMGVRPEPRTEPSPEIPWDQLGATFANTDETSDEGCYNGRLEGGGLQMDWVDCSSPHDFQLAGRIEIDSPGGYDTERIGKRLSDQCAFVQHEFTGATATGSSLFSYAIYPHRDSWRDGDRTGHCFLVGWSDERIVGSAEGSLW